MASTQTQAFDLNGAELIVRFLEAHGVTHVFAAPPSAGGGALLPLRRALAASRLTQAFAAQEPSVGFIAQGYARGSGRTGVCLANAGAGVTQMLTAIADAQANAVPLVVICGQDVPAPSARIPSAPLRTGHIVDTLTKTHFEIRAADDLVDALPEAFRVAGSGRPGPVVIALPVGAQTARIKLERLPSAACVDAADEEAPRPDWTARLAELRHAPREDPDRSGSARSRATLIRAIAHALGDDAIVVCDGGDTQRWVAQDYPSIRAERWLAAGGLGTTGFALPAAIGAALAQPGVPVVAFCDEAGTLTPVQELATLNDLQLDVKLVVLDPIAPVPERSGVQLLLPRRYLGPLSARRGALCALAESFGIGALDLGQTTDPLPRLRDALRQPGPMLIRVPFDHGMQTLPRVVPRYAQTASLH